MDGLHSILPLPTESLRGITPAAVGKALPKFEIVDPRTLYAEEAYQRSFNASSVKLIREIVADWNWALFKPPVCARLPECGNVLVVFDGQHTATAAACHPQIPKIPVMVVPPEAVSRLADRAKAFVGHNTHRIALTQLAIFAADVTAGNEIAWIVTRACQRADVTIPKSQPSAKDYRPGMTLAIGTLRAIARNAGEEVLARVLTIVRKAERSPLRSAEIAAVALMVTTEPKLSDAQLTATIAMDGPDEWALKARNVGDNTSALASNLAKAWATAMRLETRDIPVVRGERSGAQVAKRAPGAVKRAPASVKRKAAADKPDAQPVKPAPAPAVAKAAPQQNPTPAAKPQQPAAAPGLEPVKPTNDGKRYVSRNGVTLDLLERKITHRGLTVAVPSDAGIRLIASLARVMPSIMDTTILARQSFGAPVQDPKGRIRALVDQINPMIAGAKLAVRTVPNIGNTLFDLGAE